MRRLHKLAVLALLICSKGTAQCPSTSASCGIWVSLTEDRHSTIIVTYQIIKSTFISTAGSCEVATPTPIRPCDVPCGSICCAANQYCYTNNDCRMATAVAPIRPTSSTLDDNPFRPPDPSFPSFSSDPSISPTSTFESFTFIVESSTTVPFQTPIAPTQTYSSFGATTS